MLDTLNGALMLAKQQVRLFRVKPNSKEPALYDFQRQATSDTEALHKLFAHSYFNSGIACGKIAEDLYLVGFDIDSKKGKNGYDTLALLEETGYSLPPTWSQKTPSGGEHRLFWSNVPIIQGTNVFGEGSGIDLRGDGGFLVGPGSRNELGVYRVMLDLPIARFPDWAIEKFEKKATVHKLPQAKRGKPVEDQVTALAKAVGYLQSQDTVHEGGRSDACFRVVAHIKDLGLAQEQVLDVLLTYWPCEPMLEVGELESTINNAYRYSKNDPGVLAPENVFEEVAEPADDGEEGNGNGGEPPIPFIGSPLQKMNKDHFICVGDGVARICWENSLNGEFDIERYSVENFQVKHQPWTMQKDGKNQQVAKVWLNWEGRREFQSIRFDPTNSLPKEVYNLWRGFAVEMRAPNPSTLAAESANLFIEHLRENVCNGDLELFKWVMTFFAHMFQRPGEKPMVAIVIRGLKGTGKTIISEVLNRLIGKHSCIISNKEQAVGNFNSVMEDKILVTLDEAFWSGDKSVESTMKTLITGGTRMITRKGHEPYKANVFDRMIILGNDHSIVPATKDERRYTVLEIGNKRRLDTKYFGQIMDGIFKHGGDRALYDTFMKWDLSSANIKAAYETEALNDQKMLGLHVVQDWWLHCLEENRLVGSQLLALPAELSKVDAFEAFNQSNQRHSSRPIRRNQFAAAMRDVLVASANNRVQQSQKFTVGTLAEARARWDEVFHYQRDWPGSPVDELL